jgi:RNA polymerase-binding transcription factor DksA
MSPDVHDPESLKAALSARLETARARLRRLEDHLHNRQGPPSQDWDDRASEQQNDEVVDALEPLTRREVGALEAALARVAAGQAFTCQRCGEAIHPRRVASVPETALCASCAS